MVILYSKPPSQAPRSRGGLEGTLAKPQKCKVLRNEPPEKPIFNSVLALLPPPPPPPLLRLLVPASSRILGHRCNTRELVPFGTEKVYWRENWSQREKNHWHQYSPHSYQTWLHSPIWGPKFEPNRSSFFRVNFDKY